MSGESDLTGGWVGGLGGGLGWVLDSRILIKWL